MTDVAVPTPQRADESVVPPGALASRLPGTRRRTMAILMATQVIGGVGVAIGIAVGALLAASLGGTAISGFGQSSLVVGAALLAVPVTRLMRLRGRRPGLVLAYGIGALGGLVVVAGARLGSIPVVFAGLFLFGGGNAANYQARYAAVDLASPARRGRQLSWVVWATTIGAVAGPNLAPVADRWLHQFGTATYSGPFVFSAAAFGLAGVIVFALLRPDPLLLARRLAAEAAVSASGVGASDAAVSAGSVGSVGSVGSAGSVGASGLAAGSAGAPGAGFGAAVREVAASPAARLGIASVAMGHLVMIGVMSMTPVHIGEQHRADTLTLVSIVLSVHIAGMYAVSPLTGWLTDRLGRRPVILGGIVLLVAACAVAGTAGHDTGRLALGLALLGMGWSCTMVAGSTLLSESVGTANKPAVQGLSDLVMGLAGASAGALGGLVVAWSSYATLTMLAAVATVPLVALVLRPVRLVMAEGET